ncbi:putative efflux pump antibiotic resistance protein [Lindgomyces ingoldianus]|uniref:Efflux pump antibiotic resistance protein n=1 Tax=Lindgomyces ingoldianus TaxID=673940 RepID=A0ACB6QAS8_9PLEO|nr:putative efflux pump antibiotic resistance protein [Lindgomyces ingoldianus]KAF2464006.1 putative efflux pump antibiotic resistance protein [Lindgomyces ingoldianus]
MQKVMNEENENTATVSFEGTGGPLINNAPNCYLSGWRLHCTTLGIVLSLLLANLEVTIVGTSLVAIANDLQGFSETSWIVSGYLVTYMGFNIVWGKLSDIFGRKSMFILSMTIFTVWSAGCGASRTMNQLIICRAFQGIGGAGCYSLATVLTYEFVPQDKLGMYGALNSMSVALATLMGPLFGGVINNHTTWRWIFYLNIPAGAFVIAVLFIGIPNGFPHHNSPQDRSRKLKGLKVLQRVDVFGLIMLLAGSLLLSAVLLEYSLRNGWSSLGSVLLLIFAIISWIVFLGWEWYIAVGGTKTEALFPWEFMQDRPWMGILLSTFLCGMPFNVLVVFVPQRLQTVSGFSALGAGERLLPYTFSAALGAALAMIMGSKRRLAVVYIFIIGASLQTTGTALLTTLPSTSEWPVRAYGFLVIAGVGLGVSFGISILATPFVVAPKNIAVAGGSLIQFRFLGGMVGLAIVSNVFNSRLQDRLRGLISPQQLLALDQDVSVLGTFAPDLKSKVLSVFAQEYNYQNKILTAFVAAQVLAAGMVWNRRWSKLG